ncbi:hypothetical protein ETD83_23865 [Actinomadura soli]|uniref:Lipoprotein n=1 Tax=Actinomadura soli TaxID=2508997 RepID=A0A5C4J7I1_9ACTN|nr:hypothetical protein [Actinomadura soli]TMQ94556.1 hypothetical protein ETD83_23865 [Actinomadura soli]
MSKARPRRTLTLPLVALAIFLPVLAACGDSGGSAGGSGGSGGSGAAAGGGTTGKSDNRYVKYAQCMRANGVPDWPDPIDGDKFRMPMGKINPDSPGFKAAERKCEPVRPPEWRAPDDPALQAKMLKYAQCMRKNGLPDFPDPQDGKLDTGGVDPDSPQYKAADQKCQSLRPAGAGG